MAINYISDPPGGQPAEGAAVTDNRNFAFKCQMRHKRRRRAQEHARQLSPSDVCSSVLLVTCVLPRCHAVSQVTVLATMCSR